MGTCRRLKARPTRNRIEAWLVLPVIALRAWISYKQLRPIESLENRHPSRWEIGTSQPTEIRIRQWRESMLDQARCREEKVQ